jgi:hypothetical protein
MRSFLHKYGLTTYFFKDIDDRKVVISTFLLVRKYKSTKSEGSSKSALHTSGAFFSQIGLHCISLPGLIFNLDEIAEKRFSAKQGDKSTNSSFFICILGYFKTRLSLCGPMGQILLKF